MSRKTYKTKGGFWYFVYELQPNPEEVSEIRLWIALPREQPGQRVRLGNFHPISEILSDEWGNRVAFWRIHPDPDCKELVFHYDFDVICETVLTKVDPSRIQPYDTNSPLSHRFTSSEPRYELTEKVRKLAQRVIGNETNPYYQARKIFDWTVDNISYFYPDGVVFK
jgi:transglutaminase-like putative cysteine protease